MASIIEMMKAQVKSCKEMQMAIKSIYMHRRAWLRYQQEVREATGICLGEDDPVSFGEARIRHAEVGEYSDNSDNRVVFTVEYEVYT